VGIDFVILDEVSRGYERPLRDRLEQAVAEIGRRARIRGPGRAIVVAGDSLETGRAELLAAARVVLDTGAGSLAEQLARGQAGPAPLPEFVPVPGPQPAAEDVAPLERAQGWFWTTGWAAS
jgi:cyclic beta-1,2-glucan synthetase